MKKQFLYIFLAVFSIGIPAQAITNQDVEEAATLAEKYQQHKKAKVYEFSVKAGFNIGGTSPMGLPAEIRQINSFSPTPYRSEAMSYAGSRPNGVSTWGYASRQKVWKPMLR